MDYEIIHLPKEKWKGYHLPITHTPEEYNFPDKLYEEDRLNACAWGILWENRLIAAIETEPESWFNRLRITELWVDNCFHRRGIGHALIEVAKEQARQERRRAIVLETQSCNGNAITFYQHEGFTLIGLDSCGYRNDDIDRKEVKLLLGWFPKKKDKLSAQGAEIRMIQDEDWHEVERMTQLAFWNKHQEGCDEHYLVSRIRTHADYIPKISRAAVKDGEMIGAILYTKSKVCEGETVHDIVTFGPLCVHPDWQGCGVGEMLLIESMRLAAEMEIPGIVIFGEPDYYPRLGFKTCDHFEITTADGKNFDAFMGKELIPDGMKDIHGKFFESEAFEDLRPEDADAYNKNFPPLKKIYFPTQWE